MLLVVNVHFCILAATLAAASGHHSAIAAMQVIYDVVSGSERRSISRA